MGTLLQIELTEPVARGIQDFSLFPSENEALLPPNVCLQFQSQFDAGHGLVMMQFKQTETVDVLLDMSKQAGCDDAAASASASGKEIVAIGSPTPPSPPPAAAAIVESPPVVMATSGLAVPIAEVENSQITVIPASDPAPPVSTAESSQTPEQVAIAIGVGSEDEESSQTPQKSLNNADPSAEPLQSAVEEKKMEKTPHAATGESLSSEAVSTKKGSNPKKTKKVQHEEPPAKKQKIEMPANDDAMRDLLISGDINSLPVPLMKEWLRLRRWTTGGKREDLSRRIRTYLNAS